MLFGGLWDFDNGHSPLLIRTWWLFIHFRLVKVSPTLVLWQSGLLPRLSRATAFAVAQCGAADEGKVERWRVGLSDAVRFQLKSFQQLDIKKKGDRF